MRLQVILVDHFSEENDKHLVQKQGPNMLELLEVLYCSSRVMQPVCAYFERTAALLSAWQASIMIGRSRTRR